MHILSTILFLGACLVFALGGWAAWRRHKAFAWELAARQLGCSQLGASALSIGDVYGLYHHRNLRLSLATTYEDGPAYRHTCLTLSCVNPGSVALGLRRKSALESVVARRQPGDASTEDDDFDALFFLVSNDSASLPAILGTDLRNRLKRLEDVELYVVADRMVLRRAGEVCQAKDLVDMAEIGALFGDRLDSLPPRARTPAEQTADEAMIEKGV